MFFETSLGSQGLPETCQTSFMEPLLCSPSSLVVQEECSNTGFAVKDQKMICGRQN